MIARVETISSILTASQEFMRQQQVCCIVFLSPHDMRRLVIYCFFVCMFVYLSVTLSIKSTKFGGGYLINRLSELDKILHIDRPGLAVHQDWWILPKESHWNCTALLDKHLWNSRIWVDTKVSLYQTYVLPALAYGSEVWTITKALARRLDAFGTWSLRKICGPVYLIRYQHFC